MGHDAHNSLSFHDRLAWGDNGPMPFESGWSIFIKLFALNLESPSFVAKTVAFNKSDTGECYSREIRHWDSSWIDFEKFSYALGVDERKLREGFLSEFGFFENQSSIKIRHCPECIKQQYHSVLFNLEVISHCPWHGVPLEACSVCDKALRSGTRVSRGLLKSSEDSFNDCLFSCSLPCGHFSIDIHNTTTFKRPSDELVEAINIKSKSILSWWEKVFSADQSMPILLPLHFPEVKVRTYFEMQALLGAAVHVAGRIPFESPWSPLAINWLRWTDRIESRYSCHQGIPDSVRSVYKAINRHIFKRYLRRHRKCLNDILHAKGYLGYCVLDRGSCPLAIAYVVWRMRNESLMKIEDFNSNVRNDLKLCYPGRLDIDNSGLSLRSIANYFLASFFGAWAYLKNSNNEFKIIIDREYSQSNIMGDMVYINSDKNNGIKRYIKKSANLDCVGECLIYCDPNELLRDADSLCRQMAYSKGDLEVVWGRRQDVESCKHEEWTECGFRVWPLRGFPRLRNKLAYLYI